MWHSSFSLCGVLNLIVSYGFIDDDGTRILLSDEYGKLILLTILPSNSGVRPVELSLDLLGEVSRT